MDPIIVVVGTRPEIIKMAPIIRASEKKKIPFTFVHCGQHYDYNMSQQFIEELELRARYSRRSLAQRSRAFSRSKSQAIYENSTTRYHLIPESE